MAYVPGDVPALEADDTDDVDEPSGRPVDPDAVEDADLDDLREQVAGLTRTVERLVTREHDCLPSEAVVAEVAETVVENLARRGDLGRDGPDDGGDRDGLADGGTSRGFY